MDRSTLLSVPELQERGWTEALIRRFLGAPDTTAPNPHYRSGPPMRFYAQAHVEACEATPAFAEALATTRARQARAAIVSQRKREAMRAWVAGLQITVPTLDAETLARRACAHYNRAGHVPDWVLERDGATRREATPDSDPAFLARITVNYLRHQLTRYEPLLEKTYGKVGVNEARAAIVQKVYAAIAEAYPAYAKECQRQYAARQREAHDQGRL